MAQNIPLPNPWGIELGSIAYGCWRLESDDVGAAAANIETAIELGMTIIDTADIYGYGTQGGFGFAEAMLGRVLRDRPGLRDRMILATKGGITPPTPYNSTKEYLLSACDASLSRLGVDVIDLYQIHRPDLLAGANEVADALGILVDSGKVRAVGVSNYTPSQTRALRTHLSVPIFSHQSELSAWEVGPFENGLLDQCQEYNMLTLAWSPLGGGRLATGQPEQGDDRERLAAVIVTLDRLAEQHSATRMQIALAFCLSMPGRVVPIIGTQNINRIMEAADTTSINLSRRDWYDIYESRRGVKMP